MTPLCFLDTETTSLDAVTGEIWEVAVILRDQDGQAEYRWLLPVDLDHADPVSLDISRFHDRHPQGDRWQRETPGALVVNVQQWAEDFATLTDGFHLVGNVVSFDEERLRRLLRRYGIRPSWHYHLIDCECLAVGYIVAYGQVTMRRMLGVGQDDLGESQPPAGWQPPWRSDDLSAALGVTAPTDHRHTALGDARWAADLFDAVMGGLDADR